MDWFAAKASEVGHFAKNATVGAASGVVKLAGCEDSVNLQMPEYNRKHFLDRQSPDWMSTIHDDMPIWALTIPGTHDTCAMHGGDLVECQSLDLPKQLEAGIRFLDVRTRQFNDTLPIHHGIVFQQKSFSGVMADVTNFLREHPRECILMQVQKEYEGANNTWAFDALVASVCQEYAQFLPPGPETLIETVTLGQVRGKLVVFQNYDSSVNVQGAVLRGHWLDQNSWDHCMDEIETIKIPRIKEHFMCTQNRQNVLRRNWLSAASASAWPYAVARLTNPVALNHLQSCEPNAEGHGVVVCDFPGSELIAQCIRHSVGSSQLRFG